MVKEKTYPQLKSMKRLFMDDNKRKRDHQRGWNEHEGHKRRKHSWKPTSSSRLPLRSPTKSPSKDAINIGQLGIEEKKKLIQRLQEELMTIPANQNSPDLPVFEDDHTAAMDDVANLDITVALNDGDNGDTSEAPITTPRAAKSRMCTHCQASPDHIKKECPFIVQVVRRSKKNN